MSVCQDSEYLFFQFLAVFIALFLVSGCDLTFKPKDELSGKILVPPGRSEFPSDQYLLFTADVTDPEEASIGWSSNIDGLLGVGTTIRAHLSLGSHSIQLLTDNEVLDSVSLTVHPPDVVRPILEVEQEFLPSDSPTEMNFEAGLYAPVLITGSSKSSASSIKELRGQIGSETPATVSSKPRRPHVPLLQALSKQEMVLSEREIALSSSLPHGTFRLVQVQQGPTSAPVLVDAEVIYESEQLKLWIDTDAEIQPGIDFLESIARLYQDTLETWGQSASYDHDESGYLDVLITPKLNQTRSLDDSFPILGLFNPNDLFPRSNANPTSNNRDILYISMSDGDENAYPSDLILATLAHELFHLQYFYHKYYRPYLDSGRLPADEAIVFEEALSYLSECLVGYGEQSGALSIVSSYLAASGDISLSLSKEPTVPATGALMLIAYWLTEYGPIQRGAQDHYGDTSPGLSRKALLESPLHGWDAIVQLSGLSPDEVLGRWATETNYVSARAMTRPMTRFHPRTGQIATVHPFVGELQDPFRTRVSGPRRVTLEPENSSRPPLSVTFFRQDHYTAKYLFEVSYLSSFHAIHLQ